MIIWEATYDFRGLTFPPYGRNSVASDFFSFYKVRDEGASKNSGWTTDESADNKAIVRYLVMSEVLEAVVFR
jgi:hypothetical protein